MLIDLAKMAKKIQKIWFSQFFARLANGYMANPNGNPGSIDVKNRTMVSRHSVMVSSVALNILCNII